jgi:TonB family protein
MEYVPRALLTVPPAPTSQIVLPFPQSFVGAAEYTSVLALFIDETGTVRRVRVDGAALPDPLERAAREAFMQARFRPGQVSGVDVRSLIHVEVTFDSRPLVAAR